MQPGMLHKKLLAGQCTTKKKPARVFKNPQTEKNKKTYLIKMDFTQLNSVISDGDVIFWIGKGVSRYNMINHLITYCGEAGYIPNMN